MAEITKGEWKADGLIIKCFGKGIVASCPPPQDGGVFECVPNAHLIAAAPIGYELADAVLECQPLTEIRALAYKFIAKAVWSRL